MNFGNLGQFSAGVVRTVCGMFTIAPMKFTVVNIRSLKSKAISKNSSEL